MTYGQLYACAFVLMLCFVGAFGVFIWALDIVSMPDPILVAIEYHR